MKSVIAFTILFSTYCATLFVVLISKVFARERRVKTGRLMVVGTFYNPNWFLSHAQPLAESGMKEVIFVTDTPHQGISEIKFICPPLWVSRVFSRALAKLIWLFFAGLYYRPDVYIGYHIFPGALSALIVSKLLGRPSCYQMCAGPVELMGGGIHSENALMTKLSKPSPLLEKLSLKITRHFDLVAVRGKSARRYLIEKRVDTQKIAIVPGSIKLSCVGGLARRDYDIVFVGRLVEIKQPLQIIKVVAKVHEKIPDVRVAVVGEGPLREALEDYARKLDIMDSIEMLGKRNDVEAILGQSRIFLLTSRSEGLSIAMAEAMASGVVPVVADVGDLSDLVNNSVNGYLVEPNNILLYADRIVELLKDPVRLARYSKTASHSARHYNGLDVVSSLWRRHLGDLIPKQG